MPFNKPSEFFNVAKNNNNIISSANDVNFLTDSLESLGYSISEDLNNNTTNIELSIGINPDIPVTTDDLTEGLTNLYFTNERAQDAVGNSLIDSTTIDFTYDDSLNTISANIKQNGIDHTQLQNIGTNSHAQIDNHINNINNPHGVTKTQVGLSNVENTALSTWSGSNNITTVGTLSSGNFLSTLLPNNIPINHGGTNLNSIPSNGQLLIGNGTGYTLGTISTGYGLNIDNNLVISSTSTLSPYFKDDGFNPTVSPIASGNKSISIGDKGIASGLGAFSLTTINKKNGSNTNLTSTTSGARSFRLGGIYNQNNTNSVNTYTNITGTNSFFFGNIVPGSNTSINVSSNNMFLFKTWNSLANNLDYSGCDNSIIFAPGFFDDTKKPLIGGVKITDLLIRDVSIGTFPKETILGRYNVKNNQYLISQSSIDTSNSSILKSNCTFKSKTSSSGASISTCNSTFLQAITQTGNISNNQSTITWNLPNYTNGIFEFLILGKLNDSSLACAFKIKGSYKKGLSGSVGTFLSTPTKTIIARSNATFDSNISLSSDNLVLTVTYTSSDPCTWYVTCPIDIQKEMV